MCQQDHGSHPKQTRWFWVVTLDAYTDNIFLINMMVGLKNNVKNSRTYFIFQLQWSHLIENTIINAMYLCSGSFNLSHLKLVVLHFPPQSIIYAVITKWSISGNNISLFNLFTSIQYKTSAALSRMPWLCTTILKA